jgi:hypothetical protein
MASKQLSQKQWIYLVLLSLATLALWKIGAAQPQSHATGIAAEAATPGSLTKTDVKSCCEKPPNRAALLQKSQQPAPANPPAAPEPASVPVTEPVR